MIFTCDVSFIDNSIANVLIYVYFIRTDLLLPIIIINCSFYFLFICCCFDWKILTLYGLWLCWMFQWYACTCTYLHCMQNISSTILLLFLNTSKLYAKCKWALCKCIMRWILYNVYTPGSEMPLSSGIGCSSLVLCTVHPNGERSLRLSDISNPDA